jgi:glycerol kinase
MARDHVIAIDQGTTSTRVIVFDSRGQIKGAAQREHRQIFLHPGWVGHDAAEIWRATRALLIEALAVSHVAVGRISGIGITNQRETTVVWDAQTGTPIADAIVWQDTRTQDLITEMAAHPEGLDRLRGITGLPLNTYFAATKLRWILDSVPGAKQRAEQGELRFGTIDSWLVWNLTGGPKGGRHVTDVTNASRTLLMDLGRLEWSDEACALFGVPAALLPEIVPSVGVIAEVTAVPELAGVPIAGILGDQQAATFGQCAFGEGDAKNTYGTGGFLMVNTGERPVASTNGLLTTIAYQIGDDAPVYALEGSVAVAGSLHHWLRDNLGLFRDSSEIEGLATSVPDTGGAMIVPAFSGLYAPRWQADARGVIVGLTRFVTKAHLVRAASEAIAFQSVEVIDAARTDTGHSLSELRVDGGAAASDFLMQFQADLLGIDVVRPETLETTALGAAYAAGLATGVWPDLAALAANWREGRRFRPAMGPDERARRLRLWEKAVARSLDWVDDDVRASIGVAE